MKTLCAVLLVALCNQACFAVVGPDLSAGTDVKYFTKLRFDTVAKEGYSHLWQIEPDREKIIEAYRAGEFETVLKLSDAWLKQMPIDADIHLMVAMCYKEKGDLSSYCRHLDVFYGLLSSITSAGDGLTAKTPYKVVSSQEENSLVREIGGKITGQRLEGMIDVLEIERAGGKQKLTLYFDVSIQLKGLADSLKGK
jgi:hypothetical protein